MGGAGAAVEQALVGGLRIGVRSDDQVAGLGPAGDRVAELVGAAHQRGLRFFDRLISSADG